MNHVTVTALQGVGTGDLVCIHSPAECKEAGMDTYYAFFKTMELFTTLHAILAQAPCQSLYHTCIYKLSSSASQQMRAGPVLALRVVGRSGLLSKTRSVFTEAVSSAEGGWALCVRGVDTGGGGLVL